MEIVKAVNFDGNKHKFKALVGVNERASKQMDKNGLIKAKDHVKESLFKLFNGRIRMAIVCPAY